MLEAAIEESLRWDAPVLGQARTCLSDTLIRDTLVPAGSTVLVMLGAANHDPGVFADPDVFDLDRPNAAQHLAFGRGTRFCMGAGIARLEARVTLRTMFERLAGLKLVAGQPPVRRDAGQMLNLRGFQSLPIAFSASVI